MRRLMVLVAVAAVLFAVPTAASAWSTYFGPGTMTYSTYVANSGWAYWTSNRVYRPTGHPFTLAYEDSNGGLHWSTENWSDNPFYWPAYGYNLVFCEWNYWDDGVSSVYPVTCQVTT